MVHLKILSATLKKITDGWRYRSDNCRIDIARESDPADAKRNRAIPGVQSDAQFLDTEGSSARCRWESRWTYVLLGKEFLQSASTAGLSVRRERRADILVDRLPIAFDRAALENSSLLPPYQTNHVNSCDIGSGNDNGPDHDPLLILYRHPAASVRWNVLMTSNSRTMSGLLVAVCERPNSFAVSVRAVAEKYLSSSINMTLYPIR